MSPLFKGHQKKNSRAVQEMGQLGKGSRVHDLTWPHREDGNIPGWPQLHRGQAVLRAGRVSSMDHSVDHPTVLHCGCTQENSLYWGVAENAAMGTIWRSGSALGHLRK